MSKSKLQETKEERDNKLQEYEKLEQQRQELSRQQNEVGKDVIRLNGKIEALEEIDK